MNTKEKLGLCVLGLILAYFILWVGEEDYRDEIKTSCPTCHYCSAEKIKEECDKYHAKG